MKLENTVMWEEKDLFTEEGAPGCSFLGYARGRFTNNSFALECTIEATYKYELEFLSDFLASADAGYLILSEKDMKAFCEKEIKAHIPHSFGRECWGLRVLNDDIVWYIACTPWNERRHFELYAYDRKTLMTEIARTRGLPEVCCGVYPYTGERIRIRFGADGFESFPQYGVDANENRRYADEMNFSLEITRKQAAAMEGGAVYGWDTPTADPMNYDVDGHYIPPVQEEAKKGDKKKWILCLKR